MNFIEHIHEPHRLLLIWQSADPPRSRRAVAEIVRDDVQSRPVFRYLQGTPDFQAARSEGFVAFPAFLNVEQSYDLGIIETFLRRLPPRTRGDYPNYLEQFRLHPETQISDMALLGYTGAKLPSDGFSIVNPLEDVSQPCDVLIEVAGFRHTSKLHRDDLILGTAATLAEEPDNPHDCDAMAIYVGDERIGHVPRPQAPALCSLTRRGEVHMTIERINGQPERPVVYLFTRIRPHAKMGNQLQG